MSLSTSELSVADLAVATGNTGKGGGFMGNGDGTWFLLILFLFAFAGGWNNNGWGGGSGGVSENYTLISDMGQLERKIDGVYSGICDSTFALNNAVKDGFAGSTNVITQGFAGLNTALVQNGYETRNAITQDTIANMQGFNGVTSAISDCCCKTQNGLKDVNYAIATQANGIVNAVNTGFCQTNYNNANNTRDILANQDANARAILDAINANKVEALKERIAEQNQQINALNLAASQAAQNEYLISQLKPCPQGAYLVANPNGALNYNLNNCGCGC